MDTHASIYVAGHRGLVGSALVRALTARGYTNIITRTRDELDLGTQFAVEAFFEKERPEYVFLAAAKVGGILANATKPAAFIYENLMIQSHVVEAAHRAGSKKLLFLGSSCIYPRLAPQPITEDALLTGPLEETNKPYAIAKIAGIALCQAYRAEYGMNCISVMPTNLYGPHDSFDLKNAHVLPSLIRKFYEAKETSAPSVTVWGSGNPRREFLHVDDLAEACLFLMDHYNEPDVINIGTGVDSTIAELAELIKKTVGYSGKIVWDTSKPDGTPRKLLDVSKIHALGWHHAIPLEEGVKSAYAWYTTHTNA